VKYARFEELPVWQAAIDLARRMYDFTPLDPFRPHSGLRDQLERAAVSISNNVAEGFERGTTNELLAFLYIARGSAGEVRSMFCLLEGMTTFVNLRSQIADLKRMAEGISKQLHGWIEQLKNSGITGQRHLNGKSRMRIATQKDGADFLDELQRIRETPVSKSVSEQDYSIS
jgi:four helix bundle protein